MEKPAKFSTSRKKQPLTPCHGDGADFQGTRPEQGRRAGIQGCARRDDIVHKKQGGTGGNTLSHEEDTIHVCKPFPTVKTGLMTRLPTSPQEMSNGDAGVFSQARGKQSRLVKFTLPLPKRMEGYGHHGIEAASGKPRIKQGGKQ